MKSIFVVFVFITHMILSGCGDSSNAAPGETTVSEQMIGTWLITEHANLGVERIEDIVIEVIFRTDGTFDVINTSDPYGIWVVEGEMGAWELGHPNYFEPLTWSVLPGNFLRLEYSSGAMFLRHMSDFTGSQFSDLKNYAVWEKQP